MNDEKKFIEQKITQQITINAGVTDEITIDIPKSHTVLLKGYGYSWFTSNTFKLSTGLVKFPTRTDQEGSPNLPVIFGQPFECKRGGELKLKITNGDSSNHTYDVIFYILSTEYLDVASTGGQLTTPVSPASGLTTHQVTIYDPTGADTPEIVTRGDGVKALAVDTEIVIDNATLNIENLFIASTDLTVANAQFLLCEATGELHTFLSDGTDILDIVGEGDDLSTADKGIISYGKKRSDDAALCLEFDDSNNLYINLAASTGTMNSNITQLGGNSIDLGSGIIGAGTQRITLATDDTAATDLTAIKTAVEIMDDWDETDRCAVNLISGQTGVTGGSGVIDASTQRITLATDDTVATDLTAIKTALEIMDDWDETDRCAVNLISGQSGVTGGSGIIDASTQRITLATDDTVATDLTAIKTAVEIIDNAISGNEMQADIVAALPSGTNNIGKVVPTDGTTDIKMPTTATNSKGASALTVIAAGGVGNKHRLFQAIISSDSAGVVDLSDGLGSIYVGENGSGIIDYGSLGHLQDTANTQITATLTGANLSVIALYSTE